MNQPIDSQDAVVTARELEGAERMAALSKHFGSQGLRVEQYVYAIMRAQAKEYQGGYWEYFELSNGGFYMAPAHSEDFACSVPSNGYQGKMSADAAGITACLFTFSHLSFVLERVDAEGCEKVAEHYHLLLDFACNHAEARAILSAID